MTDFLEQFSNKNYKKVNSTMADESSGSADESSNTVSGISDTANGSPDSAYNPPDTANGLADADRRSPDMTNKSLNMPDKSSDPAKETPPQRFAGVKSTEHDVVIDTSYNRHKTIRIVTVSAAIVILCIAIFFGYQFFNRVQVLDFNGKSIAEARTWSLKNQIELDEQYKFDNAVNSDTILSQSVPQGKKVAKRSIITLEISKGADPDEKIEVPDFAAMTVPAIQSWIDENHLPNTQLKQENSSSVESGKYMRADFRDIAVDKDHFKRKDYLAIYISKGLEDLTANVTVLVFSGMTKTAADAWAQNNNITLGYSPQISETIALDVIISQDKEAGTTVQSGSTIQLAVSAGAGIVIPDFSQISKEDTPAIEPALSVTVKTQYSNNIPYGRRISQSVQAGKRVLATDNKVTVIYSEGKPYIDNLVGTSEKNIASYFYAFSLKGVNIHYAITYVDSSVEKGQIVWVSRYNEFISTNETILIHISKGNLP